MLWKEIQMYSKKQIYYEANELKLAGPFTCIGYLQDSVRNPALCIHSFVSFVLEKNSSITNVISLSPFLESVFILIYSAVR
jgi:hypothetical protein